MMEIKQDLHMMLNHHAGHILSEDCWCEPNHVYLTVVQGLPEITRVVEHNDEVAEHHLVTLNKRERDRGLSITDFHALYDPAITRALTPPWTEGVF